MEFQTIKYEVKSNKVAVLTFNRPESFNAFNKQLVQESCQAVQMAAADDNVRVLVLTGAGKAFTSGGDLAWLKAADDNIKKREILDLANQLAITVAGFEKILIAAVNGVAAGAGTALVLACDMAIASTQARFAPNFVNIAAVPDSAASWYLPRKVGYHKAAELMLTGSLLDAQQAYELGIFNRLVEPEQLMPYVLELAGKLAAGPQRALRYIKKMLKMSLSNDLPAQVEVEASLQLMAWSDSDFIEGVTAFIQKRPPAFK
ncbi:MAG: enoyl-CoA hydratase/isomerase family protein [Bacillota bacterium]|uniref:enoyl-CoA hydratase/isomerase family protein n=1 Tax=Desulfurispora thermophila TaxID=265470 RepID=UPI0003790A22|nr:enoyl-CoA hydratase/isomerase family protein [Desulfurispora thermophila]